MIVTTVALVRGIKKDINMGRLDNYYQLLCYTIYMWLFAQKVVLYFISLHLRLTYKARFLLAMAVPMILLVKD